ncbi:MAG: cupredoxin family protein [Pseudomonadota bacterium]
MIEAKRLIGAALLLTTLTASTALLAHSDKRESAQASPGEVIKEQKAWGIAGDRDQVSRTVTVGMDDRMRFTPEILEIEQGETIRFMIANQGQMLHEFVLGTRADLDAHAALMAKFPGMEHDEPYMAHVAPGSSAEIVWTFNRAGQFEFACLIAGHYQAGMLGQIRVLAE